MFLRLARWLRTRRIIRRCLYGFAGIVSLVLLFYGEEDWRGKRDWEQYKREWEAKGERFDFASFVPPAVPDDQNFALTPIVASTYNEFLDRHGHRINPPDTNVVDRLDLRVDSPSEWKAWPTNDFEGNWQVGIKADLKVFQTYYRASVNTNSLGRYRGKGVPNRRLNATNDFPIAPQPQSPAADVLLAFPPETLERYDRVEKINIQHPPIGVLFTSFLYIGSPYSMRKLAFAQSALDRARVACALERYRLAHGEYPTTLNLLSPQLIDKLPHDIINGQPLHYRRTDDGQFLLYSVGWNETDDGGILVCQEPASFAFLDAEKGDWVWPCQPLPVPPLSHHGSLSHSQPRR